MDELFLFEGIADDQILQMRAMLGEPKVFEKGDVNYGGERCGVVRGPAGGRLGDGQCPRISPSGSVGADLRGAGTDERAADARRRGAPRASPAAAHPRGLI